MSSLIIPILLLGLADSLNPVTIAVAVLLATGKRPVPRLITYTLGTATTYFLGGLALTLGPAVLLSTLLDHRSGRPTYIAELVIGIGALPVAAWIATRKPESVAGRVPTDLRPSRSLLLGAGITVVDLPTALMYFGAIAIIAAADIHTIERIGLLAIFNVAYVAPLILITVAVAALGHRADRILLRARDGVERWSHWFLAAITAGSGVYLIVIGLQGLISA
jgi:cytochrome c biogenesis protein CcdA